MTILVRNSTALPSQIMLVVTQLGKKKNWVLTLTGANFVEMYVNWYQILTCSEVRFVEIMEKVCDRSDHDVSTLMYSM